VNRLQDAINKNLGGIQSTVSDFYNSPNHPVSQMETSEATDLALAEEGFEDLADIYHNHMARLSSKDAPPMQ